MKYKGIYWTLFAPMIRKSITARFGSQTAEKAVRNGKAEYKRLLSRADDPGPGNPMAVNAYFAYVFAAAWLGSERKITPDGMALVMTDVLESKLMRTYFGMTDLNRTPKKWEQEMRKYEAWHAEHGKDYPVNWIVHFDDSPHEQESVYYFSRCPICEFCAREGLAELMPALCSTDEVMFRLQHGKLYRRHTIADGDAICDYRITGDEMMIQHMTIEQLPYRKQVRNWLQERYGKAEADRIWEKTQENYRNYLTDLPDYGGSRNGHAKAIYGGLLIFALYPALPDQPPVSELQDFVQHMFMGPFTKLGRIIDLNRPFDMKLIDAAFRKSGNRDRRDILRYPAGFINIDAPYDREHHAASYSFTQCPNAEFAKKHGLLHVLPLLCNSDFFGISEIHGQLIRCGTCGNSDACDYLVAGNRNPIAGEYETVYDEQGFLVSRKKGMKQ